MVHAGFGSGGTTVATSPRCVLRKRSQPSARANGSGSTTVVVAKKKGIFTSQDEDDTPKQHTGTFILGLLGDTARIARLVTGTPLLLISCNKCLLYILSNTEVRSICVSYLLVVWPVLSDRKRDSRTAACLSVTGRNITDKMRLNRSGGLIHQGYVSVDYNLTRKPGVKVADSQMSPKLDTVK